ncbi:MAG: hypothetical protein JSV28_01950 [Deltaproteobacteria bacterium]|jgi:hypothetical protein|nr:MAG: hypothetical protein JSV28_01950 [Deltaproteobacteria bacterium]
MGKMTFSRVAREELPEAVAVLVVWVVVLDWEQSILRGDLFRGGKP